MADAPRHCWVCLRYEVQPDGWCRKCGNFIGPKLGTAIASTIIAIVSTITLPIALMCNDHDD